MYTPVELRKFKDKKRGLKITLLHHPETKTYTVQQNEFTAKHKKLSAANYHFEDLVFQLFHNRIVLSEWVVEDKSK